MPDGYGESHNWHKKSIFWELPYWKDQLVRHNLDVMHIEKNFFDNIMHTLLNVQGKTKDNVKSRRDLVDICARSELHITADGKLPVPVFRLTEEAKRALFEWAEASIKFPDGYVSNFSRCVEQGQKFSGMKSHDCHVFMQRLLPFALRELLPQHVHEAIAGIGLFFRELCARTLTEDGIGKLKSKIPVLLCNMEKIFPPSFFDVMEHLPIHLPHEAYLAGPVHFRWMYPFERYMGFLKKKAKNLARVEGSIVAGSLTEETSHFTQYYFSPSIQTKKNRARRYDDGGEATVYNVPDVPDIFCQIGRLAGKLKEEWWEDYKYTHSAHTYILRNCEYVQPLESLFDSQIRETYPNLPDHEYDKYKDKDFAKWLQFYVNNGYSDVPFPLWFHELIQGPVAQIVTAPMYFTRGYTFQTYQHGSRRSTANYGVCVRGETDFYGVINQILQVKYPGMVGLRCVLFRCDWYDPIVGRGVRVDNLGVTDVNANRRYKKFEPFVLASQVDQVTFVPYPRIKERREQWLSVIHVSPRGRIIGTDQDAVVLQENRASEETNDPIESTEDVIHVDPSSREEEDVPSSDNEDNIVDSGEDEDEDDEVESDEEEASSPAYVSDETSDEN